MTLPKGYFLRQGFNFATNCYEKRDSVYTPPKRKHSIEVNSQPEAVHAKSEAIITQNEQYTLGLE